MKVFRVVRFRPETGEIVNVGKFYRTKAVARMVRTGYILNTAAYVTGDRDGAVKQLRRDVFIQESELNWVKSA